MWRKAAILLVAGQDERGFIMAYAVPSMVQEEFVEAFRYVEDSWRTLP